MPLEVAEIVKKVRRLQIVASRQVDDLLAGAYRSVFKGRGMEFDEVREYAPGDDVRTIDWNVTARAGHPYVKRYAEERELTILFLVDISRSGLFGTRDGSKLDRAIEVAALLMLSAQKNNDKIGLLLFGCGEPRYFPPRKGRAATRRLIRELVAADPSESPDAPPSTSPLADALAFVRRVQRRRAIVFLLSDFQDEGFDQALRVANVRHEVIPITLEDPRERSLPPVGFLWAEDPETGEIVAVDTRHAAVRRLFETTAGKRRSQLHESLRRSGVEALAIDTGEAYASSLMRFFQRRERRSR